ncbi:HAD-like protein [Tuber magnatum]|uniref:Mitochondrial import inner membrane translocase subunit TIM50 n=1 Tax=Tuber magnatum TaxID=42249 RepID=A0A317T3K8_9PEZI|nr:HAD-like protein [Tuber magnatum]
MSERREIPSLGSEEACDPRREKKPFSTELDERTGISHGETMELAFQTSYGSSLTPTGQEIHGLQKDTASSFAHLIQETGSPGMLGGERWKPKRGKGKVMKEEGKGKGSRSKGQGVQLARRESLGFTGSTTAPPIENSRVRPSENPFFNNLAASGGLFQESYDNYPHGSIPMLDPAGTAPSWALGGSHRPFTGVPEYSQKEGISGWRQSATTYPDESWGHRSEGAPSWAHGAHRLQLPSRQQFLPNPRPGFFNPPFWQQQQPRRYHYNRYQGSRLPRDHRPQVRGSRFSSNSTPLPAPVPTKDYLAKSLLEPQTLPKAPKQLLVLDLNGTLVHRRRSDTANPVCRPELDSFLDYIFAHFSVMVWTSAQPENAQRMVNGIFTKEQKNKLLAVWARDTLQLTPNQYREKTTVYKRLTRIWAGEFKLRFPSPHQSGPGWDQTNTILMDDSSVKAAGQPYNLIRVPEFVGEMEGEESTVLSDCIKYLNELRFRDNVSAYIRQSPFYGRY